MQLIVHSPIGWNRWMSKSLKLDTDSYTLDFDMSKGETGVEDSNDFAVSDDAVNMALFVVVTVVMARDGGKMLESTGGFEYDGIIELFINAHK